MKLFSFLFIGLVLSFTVRGQEHHCYTTEVYTDLIKQHPEVLQTQAELEKFTQQYIAGQAQQRTTGTVYIIPVVFHIIHNYGPENISDEQVMDAVRILNLDFRKRNNDTADIMPAFKSIAADCSIEFRLANKDPNGNCTNGIDRVVSSKTYLANDGAKLNPWDSYKYLNIWVVNSLSNADAAAYSYYPGTASKAVDGVIARYNYVGSIGTGGLTVSRTLTHEIGHYLNLSHPWGNSNSPGVSCGDDGVGDTPETMGWTNCNLVGLSCGNTIDNVQNYMEYSYCDRMFTKGQGARMLAALGSGVSGRNNLWSSTNATATGINLTIPNACAPKADFILNHSFICSEQAVQFTDLSWNGQPASWNWSFPGGTPATSTDSMPTVYYNVPGTYNATLTVSNSKGSNSTTKNSLLIVGGGASFSAPFVQDFESSSSFPGYDASIVNPDNGPTWVRTTSAGSSGSASFMIKNYTGNPPGETDAYVTAAYNLTYITQPTLTFKVANAQRSSTSADRLKVYISDNCGTTWLQKYSKVGASLATAGTVGSNFVPTSSSQWRLETVNMSMYAGKPNVRIKFESVCDRGNNTYIDDINLNGVVGINETSLSGLYFDLYPNPSHGESVISFELLSAGNAQISVLDMTGRKVQTLANARLNAGPHQFSMSSSDLAKGVYFVELVVDGSRSVKKLIVN